MKCALPHVTLLSCYHSLVKRSHNLLRSPSLWMIVLEFKPSVIWSQSLCSWPYTTLLPICQGKISSTNVWVALDCIKHALLTFSFCCDFAWIECDWAWRTRSLIQKTESVASSLSIFHCLSREHCVCSLLLNQNILKNAMPVNCCMWTVHWRFFRRRLCTIHCAIRGDQAISSKAFGLFTQSCIQIPVLPLVGSSTLETSRTLS